MYSYLEKSLGILNSLQPSTLALTFEFLHIFTIQTNTIVNTERKK